MGAAGSVTEQGDDALRLVGTVELWKNIIVSGLLCVVGIAVIVALVRYHHDWKRGSFGVKSVHCDAPHTHTSCDDDHDHCSTTRVTHCSAIVVDGFAQPFSADFVEGKQPTPTVGAHVDVFYDPHDKAKAMLAHNDFVDAYKTWIIVGLAVLCASAAVSAGFQYYVRNSHLAQRVAGGAAVFQMVSD